MDFSAFSAKLLLFLTCFTVVVSAPLTNRRLFYNENNRLQRQLPVHASHVQERS